MNYCHCYCRFHCSGTQILCRRRMHLLPLSKPSLCYFIKTVCRLLSLKCNFSRKKNVHEKIHCFVFANRDRLIPTIQKSNTLSTLRSIA